MKAPLRNLKKVPLEIVQLMYDNNLILNLIYNDERDALENPIPLAALPLEELIKQGYFSFYVPVEQHIDNPLRNTCLSIVLKYMDLEKSDLDIQAEGSIYILTDYQHILLEQNKNRILELADKVVEVLDNHKLSSSGAIMCTTVEYVAESNFHCVYKINFVINDQINRKAEL